MSETKTISWNPHPDNFRGDIAATLAMTTGEWEEVGAKFSRLDEDDGDNVELASATLGIGGEQIPFGVLTYGEDSTYLLLDCQREEISAAVRLVLDRLIAFRMLSRDRILDHGFPAKSARRVNSENGGENPRAARRKRKALARTKKGLKGNRLGAAHAKNLKGKVVALDGNSGYVVVRPVDGSKEFAVPRHQIKSRANKGLAVGSDVVVSKSSKPVRWVPDRSKV